MTWTGGGARARNNAAAGIHDRAGSRVPGGREWNDMMAAAAEDFVATRLGIRRERRVSSPDGGWDHVLPDGRVADTKWTPRENGRLQCDVRSRSVADVYILVVGATIDDFLIAGWATKAELKRGETIWTPPSSQPGRTPCWSLPQSSLHDIDEL